MITRKTRAVPSSAVWPFTPESSPRLLPVIVSGEAEEQIIMSGREYVPSRPISLALPREHTITFSPSSRPSGRPTLDDVLNNRAPPPYTLSAYMAFLSQQHCLETLEFTLESKKYREKYDEAAAQMAGMPLNTESDEGFELQQEWMRILDVYVKPGAPREINLPSVERDDLLEHPYAVKPPPPEALEPSVKRMYDLMSDSIFIPFCNSLKVSYAHTYNPQSDFGGREDPMDVGRSTFHDRDTLHQQKSSRRRRSPPSTSHSSFDMPSRTSPTSHRHTQSSTLSSALGRATSNRLSTHVSNSSAASADCALTDDSGSGESPGPGEPMTPPTTPPTGDVGVAAPHVSIHSGPRPVRSDSGNWRKMGSKIWGKKKSAGTLREQSDES